MTGSLRSFALAFLCVLLPVTGCGDDDGGRADAGPRPDADQGDGGGAVTDAPTPDVPFGQPDGGPDATPSDAGPDAGVDIDAAVGDCPAPDGDDDADTICNSVDVCPGADDRIDSDSDGVPDGCDICPAGDDTIDNDTDGVPDACDLCPTGDDALDADSDGVADGCDVCDGGDDTVDPDTDGIPTFCDNCANVANPAQQDADGDGVGNACDNCVIAPNPDQVDIDADGDGNVCDNCLSVANADQADGDSDGDGNVCDNCPTTANPDQADSDMDGTGNACDVCDMGPLEMDTDGDGVCDGADVCPGFDDTLDTDADTIPDGCDECPGGDDGVDLDGDGTAEFCDNCQGVSNLSQADTDTDGDGDACDNCLLTPNEDQADGDSDGVGTVCDNCPTVANGPAAPAGQENSDTDGLGDACDNCDLVGNPGQEICTTDGDELTGDACDDDDDGDGALDTADSTDCDRCLCNDSDSDMCDDCAGAGAGSGFACATSGTDSPSTDGPEEADERGGPDGLCNTGDPDDDDDECLDENDPNDTSDSVCGDCAGKPGDPDGDADGCDDCVTGSGPPNGTTDGPDCDMDGSCAVSAGGTDTDDDGDGVASGSDSDDGDARECRDQDSDTCDDCAINTVACSSSATTASTTEAGEGANTDDDDGGRCDLTDNCPLTTPDSNQANFDGDANGDICDQCPIGDDSVLGGEDNIPTQCDNCPVDANAGTLPCTCATDGSGNPIAPCNCGQPDSDPACAGGSAEDPGNRDDLGNACDNCDSVCNDQTNTYGIRATEVASPTAINSADCADSNNGYSGENGGGDGDDLQLADDGVSMCFDLEDENMNGSTDDGGGGTEVGDFDFMFFGRPVEAFRVANNGYLLLYYSMADCAAAGQGAGSGVGFSDPLHQDAGLLGIYDGFDNVIAAGWTDFLTTTGGSNTACVGPRQSGDNGDTNQVIEITWENMRFNNDTDPAEPATMQIRLIEGTDRIEVIYGTFNSALVTGADQTVTRGVEGLWENCGSEETGAMLCAGKAVGTLVVSAAYLDPDVADPGTNGPDEIQTVLNRTATPATPAEVEFFTDPSPSGETNAVEGGDACDNLVIDPQCGDSFCYGGFDQGDGFGPETSDPSPPAAGSGEPDTQTCGADCACPDGVCDYGENEEDDNTCFIATGHCPADCNPGTVPARDGCCGDDICDTDEGEDAASPGGACGTCHQDCAACCGDLSCDPLEGVIENGAMDICGTCLGDCPTAPCCGNGSCEAGNAENSTSCPLDCFG